MKNVPAAFIALIAIIVLIALGWLVLNKSVADEYLLPLIAVFAMAAMFAVIAFIAAVYKAADPNLAGQALGLPEGSVRALIALSLIVVFAVITLFMLARLTSPTKICAEIVAAMSQDNSAEKPSDTPPTDTASTAPKSDTATTTATSTSGSAANDSSGKPPGGTPPEKTPPAPAGGSQQPTLSAQALDIIKTRQQAAQELAKQLLTMLGTLLAAVSSFYFGSAAASSSTDPTKIADAAKTISTINKP